MNNILDLTIFLIAASCVAGIWIREIDGFQIMGAMMLVLALIFSVSFLFGLHREYREDVSNIGNR